MYTLSSYFFLINSCSQAQSSAAYGSNDDVGKYVEVNGFKMYYEEYGNGEPLFIIHGNGGSISAMRYQIDFFKLKYKVIVADSRGHGRSELNTDSLNYGQMAKDWLALADYLKVESINVLGWSDGGIIGLEMAIDQPERIKKLITMGANLQPDSTAVYPWAIASAKKLNRVINQSIANADNSQNWELQKQQLDLLIEQPNIAYSELSKITAAVLIMAGDKDIVREEHTIEIFRNINRAQLCILPGATHNAPVTESIFFNQVVNNFLSKPFIRPSSNPF